MNAIDDLSMRISKCSDTDEIMDTIQDFILPQDPQELAMILSTAYSNYKSMTRENQIYIAWLLLAKKAFLKIGADVNSYEYSTLLDSCKEIIKLDPYKINRHFIIRTYTKIVITWTVAVIIIIMAVYILLQAFKEFGEIS